MVHSHPLNSVSVTVLLLPKVATERRLVFYRALVITQNSWPGYQSTGPDLLDSRATQTSQKPIPSVVSLHIYSPPGSVPSLRLESSECKYFGLHKPTI